MEGWVGVKEMDQQIHILMNDRLHPPVLSMSVLIRLLPKTSLLTSYHLHTYIIIRIEVVSYGRKSLSSTVVERGKRYL